MSTEISPEDVVADFFAADGTDYDDSGNGWFHEVKANGNVIEIAITPSDDDGVSTEEPVHFRAVVVEGEETPVLLAGLDEAKIRADERARCVAELRTHGGKRMDAAVAKVSTGDNNGLADVSYAATIRHAATLLESGELTSTAPTSLSVSSGEAESRG